MARSDSTLIQDFKVMLVKGAKGDGVPEVEQEIERLRQEVTDLTRDMIDEFDDKMDRLDNILSSASVDGYTVEQHTFNISKDDWVGSKEYANYDITISGLPEGSLVLGDCSGYKDTAYSDPHWKDDGVLRNVFVVDSERETTIEGTVYFREIYFNDASEFPKTQGDWDALQLKDCVVIVFVAVPASSTNSELTDVRVGYDGEVYQTAGEAVRSQIEDLHDVKVNLPLENDQPTYGTDGQLLRTHGDGTTEWSDIGQPTDEQTESAVNKWLDAHPEATTTVEDGSITTLKLANKAVTKEKLSDELNEYLDDEEAERVTIIHENVRTALIPYYAMYDTFAKLDAPNTLGYYETGERVVGMQYSSRYRRSEDIYYNRNVSTFYSAVKNPASKIYTELGGTGQVVTSSVACYYGGVCSSFASKMCGSPVYYTTHEMNNDPSIFEFYVYDIDDVKVGDCIINSGHIIMVYDLERDADGNVSHVITVEQEVPVANIKRHIVSKFESYLEQFGGTYKIGRFVGLTPKLLPRVEYATDVIPDYGDRTYYYLGDEIWLYIPKGNTLYYSSDGETFNSVSLSSLTSDVVNGVVVYEVSSLISGIGTYYFTTSTSHATTKCQVAIIDTGTISLDTTNHIVTLSGYSGNITPLYFETINLREGTADPYDTKAPEGYIAGTMNFSKTMIEGDEGEYILSDSVAVVGYYIRVYYDTGYGLAVGDSDYVFLE